jgi:hypothetical protein
MIFLFLMVAVSFTFYIVYYIGVSSRFFASAKKNSDGSFGSAKKVMLLIFSYQLPRADGL